MTFNQTPRKIDQLGCFLEHNYYFVWDLMAFDYYSFYGSRSIVPMLFFSYLMDSDFLANWFPISSKAPRKLQRAYLLEFQFLQI